jgi:hypothetical protein
LSKKEAPGTAKAEAGGQSQSAGKQ